MDFIKVSVRPYAVSSESCAFSALNMMLRMVAISSAGGGMPEQLDDFGTMVDMAGASVGDN